MPISAFGFKISRATPPGSPAPPDIPVEFDAADRATLEAAQPFTMTSLPRLSAVIKATRYIVENAIPGSIVECGVWRGGSMIAAARTLARFGDQSRDIYLFDTYEGMPPPSEVDKCFDGQTATHLLATDVPDGQVRAVAHLDDVRNVMLRTGYPAAKMHFVKGKVEDTIPATVPDRIALLRLDTDWYESTRHELNHLYPLLSPGGVLIIDDFGHWQGARRAVEEYFATLRPSPLLNAIDYTGRIGVKPA